ncbi:MAG: penicillin-binding protein 2 [Elusimicrobiales bacterium]
MAQIKIPRERLEQLWLAVWLAGALISVRLAGIQLVRHGYYSKAAERNRTHIIYRNAPRGRMLTADGVAIASSEPSFSLIYLPGRLKDPQYLKQLARDFAPRLSADYDGLLETLQRAFDNGAPVRLAENLSSRSMFAFSELKTLYPGIDLVEETKRWYPYGKFASHLTGYMGRMDLQEWKAARGNGGYRIDSRLGRSGIEKMYEKQLKGGDGGLYLEVDSRGRLRRMLANKPWRSGSDIHLTLDFQAQKAAEEGLKGSLTKSGAAIAINPANGDVLALACAPDFDPNMFVVFSDSQASAAPFKTLPEYNLVTQGTFAPGSTFKIITAAAALETDSFSTEDEYFCPGYYNAGSRVFKCHEKKGHGRADFFKGMAKSCDVYFYNLGIKIGPAQIENYERAFRLGQPTGIDIPGEKAGHVFGPGERARRKTYWFIGDTLNLSIGQGELLVTPAQMAQVIGAVANGGVFWKPQYVESITGPDGSVEYKHSPQFLDRAAMKPQSWDTLRRALKLVVDEGSGQAAKIKGLEVYGKTGTAQNPQGGDNSWFVAYARRPGQQSRVAVAVLIQHGGHGGVSAAPVAKEIIKAVYRWDEKTGAPAGAAAPPPEKPDASPGKSAKAASAVAPSSGTAKTAPAQPARNPVPADTRKPARDIFVGMEQLP